MINFGEKVLIKRGIFVGKEGTVVNKFYYNGIETYVVIFINKKDLSDKYITTVSEGDMEIVH